MATVPAVVGEIALRSATRGCAPVRPAAPAIASATSRAAPSGTIADWPTTSSSVGSSSNPSASRCVRSLRSATVATTRTPPLARTRPIAPPIAPGLMMPTVITPGDYSASREASFRKLQRRKGMSWCTWSSGAEELEYAIRLLASATPGATIRDMPIGGMSARGRQGQSSARSDAGSQSGTRHERGPSIVGTALPTFTTARFTGRTTA